MSGSRRLATCFTLKIKLGLLVSSANLQVIERGLSSPVILFCDC